MSKYKIKKLKPCSIDTNCKLIKISAPDLNNSFSKLVKIAESLPRTSVITSTDEYWHGICRSLIFRFPDDLEILKITSEGIIQIKSSSRFGVSDLGVNNYRIKKIHKELRLATEE